MSEFFIKCIYLKGKINTTSCGNLGIANIGGDIIYQNT